MLDLLLLTLSLLCLAVFQFIKTTLQHINYAELEDRLGQRSFQVVRVDLTESPAVVRLLESLSLLLLCLVIVFLVKTYGFNPRQVELWLGLAAAAILGRLVPVGIAVRHPESGLLRMIGFYRLIRWRLLVLVHAHERLLSWGGFIAGGPGGRARDLSSERLESSVSAAEVDGAVDQEGRAMIEGVMEIQDLTVADVMTPRTDMKCVPIDASLYEVITVAREYGHSRLPVFRESRDQIVGVIYIRDFLYRLDDKGNMDGSVATLMRQASFVPESKALKDLLGEMRSSSMQMAIVLDEYGGTAGLVTVEDMVEQIVGDIKDEYVNEQSEVVEKGEGQYQIVGHMKLEDFNELCDVELPLDQDYESVAGFLLSSFGRIPEEGEALSAEGWELKVTEATDRRIVRVLVTQISPPSPQNEEIEL